MSLRNVTRWLCSTPHSGTSTVISPLHWLAQGSGTHGQPGTPVQPDTPGHGQDMLALDNEAVLYIHWPYCVRRCSYCNFNKYISKSVNHERMIRCLTQETKTLLELSGVTKINTIFFGGGTPSLAPPGTVSSLIDTVRDHVTFTEGSEVTLEANPTHLESQKLKEFHDAGVNRVSLGVQGLLDDDLGVLGRDHSVQDALRCVEEAKVIFPGRTSVDLMFGRPGQTIQGWSSELQQIVDICDNHVSLYQLTLERGTQLYKWVDQGLVQLPDGDTMADMYSVAVQFLQDHGLARYEVSNFARKGAESQHNLAYWRGTQYIGVGPGAHGRFTPVNQSEHGKREARIQTLEPDNWMFEVEKYGHGTRKIVTQTLQDRLEEMLCLGLRTAEGVTNQRWSSLCSQYSLEDLFRTSTVVEQFIQDGLLELDARGLRATSAGLAVLDSLIPHLLVVVSQSVTCESVT